ncbi:MAG: cysteine hydrolase [Clostridiales bacterium]
MNKILVVVDMQNDFIYGSLGTKEAQAIVENAVAKVKSFHGEIIFTKDTHTPNYLNTQEGKNLPVEHCIENTQGWMLENNLEDFIREHHSKVINKVTFGSVELGEYLKNINKKTPISEICLMGLCTDICVIANAMVIKAFLPETFIWVDEKCCAGVTPQSHKQAMAAMAMCQIPNTAQNEE